MTSAADFISHHLSQVSPISICSTKAAAIDEHFHLSISLTGRNRTINTVAMVDSGASTLFINKRLVEQNNIRTYPYKSPIKVRNIDGTDNKAGNITHFAVLKMGVAGRTMEEIFTVTDIGGEDVIIGIDWLKHYDPKISFRRGTFEFPKETLYASATTVDDQEAREIKEKLPPRYWKYIDIFRKSKAERLPEHKPTDHAINLKPDFVPTKAKPYPMSASPVVSMSSDMRGKG